MGKALDSVSARRRVVQTELGPYFSRMIVNGSTPIAREAGNTLDTSTATDSTSGAAAHTQTGSVSMLPVTCVTHLATASPPSIPATVPTAATRAPATST